MSTRSTEYRGRGGRGRGGGGRGRGQDSQGKTIEVKVNEGAKKFKDTTIYITVDNSGSMKGAKLEQVISSIREIVDKVPHYFRFFFRRFSDEVNVIVTKKKKYLDLDQVFQALRKNDGGRTALYDAWGDTLNEIDHARLNNDEENVYVLIFTDGEDNMSQKYTLREVIRKLEDKLNNGNLYFTFVQAGGATESVQQLERNFSNNPKCKVHSVEDSAKGIEFAFEKIKQQIEIIYKIQVEASDLKKVVGKFAPKLPINLRQNDFGRGLPHIPHSRSRPMSENFQKSAGRPLEETWRRPEVSPSHSKTGSQSKSRSSTLKAGDNNYDKSEPCHPRGRRNESNNFDTESLGSSLGNLTVSDHSDTESTCSSASNLSKKCALVLYPHEPFRPDLLEDAYSTCSTLGLNMDGSPRAPSPCTSLAEKLSDRSNGSLKQSNRSQKQSLPLYEPLVRSDMQFLSNDWKVRVENVPNSVQDTEVVELFRQWGNCRLLDCGNEISSAFGTRWFLLCYEKEKDRESAFLSMSGTKLHGKTITVLRY